MFPSSFSGVQATGTKTANDNRNGAALLSQRSPNPAISHLLSAAIVNRRFAQILLNDPARALENGYQGEKFDISDEERAAIVSIRAATLQEFAVGIIGRFSPREAIDSLGL